MTLGDSTLGTTAVPGWQLGVGGVLIGFGARLSDGCTSGHGICGLASLQLPSLLAVLTFLATALVSRPAPPTLQASRDAPLRQHDCLMRYIMTLSEWFLANAEVLQSTWPSGRREVVRG